MISDKEKKDFKLGLLSDNFFLKHSIELIFKEMINQFKSGLDKWRETINEQFPELGITDTASIERQVEYIVRVFGWRIRNDEYYKLLKECSDYHDRWIKDHNKLVKINRIIENYAFEDIDDILKNVKRD